MQKAIIGSLNLQFNSLENDKTIKWPAEQLSACQLVSNTKQNENGPIAFIVPAVAQTK